jgi:tetratricopeptide (TPR) repeat protein
MAILNQLIEASPLRASLYNNRAQLFQMERKPEQAMADLNQAIQHCDIPRKVASQAYAQRGVLYRVQGNDEAARSDFEKAASYGNAWAKRMAVKLNPYAALCNQMLAQAMKELTEPAPPVAQAKE